MSTISMTKGKAKSSTSNANNSGGGRSGIPTLRSLRTLFAPTSVQTKPISPSSPSLNLPAVASRRKSLNLIHGSAQAGDDIPVSSLDIVRRSMTLGRRTVSRTVSRDGGEESRLDDQKKEMKAAVMDIRPDSPLDLSTIVEADTSGLSLAESLSKHLPALPTESESRSVSFSPSPSPSPSPYPNSASVSSLNLPRSPSSINAQVHSALQVDPALAALLSPNNLSFSPTHMSAPPSPRSPPSRTQSSLNPQHASTPYSSLRVKKPHHLGLARPPYIRDPSSDESRSSISRPLSSASATRPGSSMSTSALARTPHTPSHTRTRSMSVDEHPRPTSKGGSLFVRDFNELPRRHHHTTHNRSLSHFSASQNDVADAAHSRKNLQRPPITEWLGPRTAKAFKAAGLLGSNDHLRSPSTYSYFDSYQSASPASAPNSPSRPRFRPTSSHTPDSPHSPSSPILNPHPRSASVAASAISAISARSGGSVRSASTAATSLSVSASAQATKEYLMQSQNQAQLQKLSQFQPTLASSSSTLNIPTLSSPIPSVSGHKSALISELQQLKDQHSAETSALLAALSDAQRTARILRAENDELRDALALSKAKQNDPERERLETQLAEMKTLLGEVKGKRREEVKELNSRLQEAQSRAVGAESALSEFKNINLKLRQALHASQREKACVEAEAETRAEEALRRIEQLEDALAEASGAIGNTISMARTHTESDVEATSEFHTDSQSGVRVRSRPWTNESTPSSASSSRPASIFPLPPENMSLLMYESVDGVERSASEFDMSLENIHVGDIGIDVDSILDARETQWRQSMHMNNDSTYPSDRSRTNPHSRYHSSMYNYGQNPSHSSYGHSYEFQEDEGTGNAPFLEGDSIISSEGDQDSLDPDGDPTVHADAAHQYRSPDSYSRVHRSQLYASLSASSSPPSTLRIKTTGMIKAAAKDEDDDGSTSFEGTGTPGSPGSLLWMDPAVERHLGDLNDSVESLSRRLS